MPILWKRLCGLGAIFWGAMTAYDYYHGSILVPGEFIKNDLNKMFEEESKIASPFSIDESPENQWSYWTFFFAYLLMMTLAGFVYLILKFYPKKLSNPSELVVTNNSICTALLDKTYQPLDSNAENVFIINEDKYEACTADHLKSIEENAELSREVVALNKKLDGLNDEKRNLTRFLAQSEKDNRLIKQKMMEVLKDKNVLLKRLEAATREIRSNTVARQTTLDKLEESIHCSNQLKQQIKHLCTEKTELLRRLRYLENQCKSLKKQNSKPDFKSTSGRSLINGVKVPSNIKVGDSSKDIEQIEMKLHDLEASLEKMKLKSSDKKEESDSDENEDTSESEPKILRQVSSNDVNFLSEVEPSYTNLLGKFECDKGDHLRNQIVESIAPAVGPYDDMQRKFAVMNTFGNSIFNIVNLIQKQQYIGGQLQSTDPVIVNYAVVCNYKCPYTKRLAMLGSRYFTSLNDGKEKNDKTKSASQQVVPYSGH